METAVGPGHSALMTALLVGFIGICLVWTFSRRMADRHGKGPGFQPKPADDKLAGTVPAADPDDPAVHNAVYKKLSNLRLISFAGCLIALGLLYLGFSRGFVLGVALGAISLQFYAWKVRADHLRARHLIPDKDQEKALAKLAKKNKKAKSRG